MPQAGVLDFDTTVQQTNELLDQMESTFAWKNKRHQTYDLLKASLHALRDRLPVYQAINLSSELPLLVRGFYFEGWNPDNVPLKYNKAQFIDHVRKNFTYATDEDLEQLVSDTLSVVMKTTISNGTHQQLKEMLPEEIAELLG